MTTHDALDRAFPNANVLLDESLTINEADLYGIMEPLAIHGPLYTSYLVQFQYFYRDHLRRRRERPSDLARFKHIRYAGETGGPVLERPKRQFPKEFDRPYLRRMMLRYGLTERGKAILRQAGRDHPISHGGWWEHQTANACITASLHLAALHQEQRFYTPDEIAGDDIGRSIGDHRLVPDYLCAIDRYYAIETDLGNEVGRASADNRKTYDRMVAQYQILIGDRLYHEAYAIPPNKPMLVLFVSTSKRKLALFENIVREKIGACSYILMRHVPEEAFHAYHSPAPMYDLWTAPWRRVGRPDFYLSEAGRQ